MRRGQVFSVAMATVMEMFNAPKEVLEQAPYTHTHTHTHTHTQYDY